jgi:hypothetical protein
MLLSLFLSLASANPPPPAYICGLSHADVLAMRVQHEVPPHVSDDGIRAPFDCSAYGTMCADYGVVATEAFVCNRLQDSKAGVDDATYWDHLRADALALQPLYMGPPVSMQAVFPLGPLGIPQDEPTVIASEYGQSLVGGLILLGGAVFVAWMLDDFASEVAANAEKNADADDTGDSGDAGDSGGGDSGDNSTSVWCPPPQQPECMGYETF